VDAELVKLLDRRARLSKKIGAARKEAPNAPIAERAAMIELAATSSGDMPEAGLREILTKGIEEINKAEEGVVQEISDHVLARLKDAFGEHARELGELSSSKKRFFGFEVAPWVVSTSVTLGAVLSGWTVLSVLAVLFNRFGTPTFRDIWKRAGELDMKEEKLARSPVAILFRHRQ
jgi:chorismate mutase